MKTDWVQKFQDRFMEIIELLPFYSTLSFSGGIESSAIFFGMVENGEPPYECITFRVGTVETKDTYYAKKICEYYHVPLTIVDVPILPKIKLIKELQTIIDTTGISRNIDVQCCHAYFHMIKKMDTPNLITGFYEDVHYEANKRLFMMFRKMRKGEINRKFFDEYYKFGRECIYHGQTRNGTIHNYKVIEKFLAKNDIVTISPFRDKQLFDITQQLTFEDTNFLAGKFKKKWFITDVMFKEYFRRFGNAKNSNNMHTQGLKQYHRKVLLDKTPYKDTVAVYNRIKNGEYRTWDKNQSLRLF